MESKAAITQSRAYMTCSAFNMCCRAACLAADDSKVSTTRDNDGLIGEPPLLAGALLFAMASPPRGSMTPVKKKIKNYIACN